MTSRRYKRRGAQAVHSDATSSRSPLVRCFARAVAVLALVLFPALAESQQDPAAAGRLARAKAALAPIASIVGRWEGDADVTIGPGATRRIRQSEEIVAGAGGGVIFIRGSGRSTDASDSGAIVFEAAAALWTDPVSGSVRMRTFRDGAVLDPSVEIRPDSLTWAFDVPGGRVRYVIALATDTWHEVGHFLREGQPPVQIIDMRLRRIP
jgi:hypothetical protein